MKAILFAILYHGLSCLARETPVSALDQSPILSSFELASLLSSDSQPVPKLPLYTLKDEVIGKQ
jgi:hypothetical protein